MFSFFHSGIILTKRTENLEAASSNMIESSCVNTSNYKKSKMNKKRQKNSHLSGKHENKSNGEKNERLMSFMFMQVCSCIQKMLGVQRRCKKKAKEYAN